jgi:DNA-binding response OmpR family regulator
MIGVVRQRRTDTIAKILILTFNDDEEKAIEKVLSVLSDEIGLEAVKPVTSSVLSFPGLEIKLYQRRVLRDGEDIYLTRLEYGALCYLAASPGRVFTKAQIFESVWSMESESCQSSVASVICNLRKKIEPDSKNPTYIKTILGIGYKFASGE